MEPENTLFLLKVFATCPYPELEQFSHSRKYIYALDFQAPFSLRFPNQTPVYVSPISNTCNISPISFFSIWSPE